MFATISPKGQITIPHVLRERLGLGPAMRVEIEATEDGKLILSPEGGQSRGERALTALRSARGRIRMSTEEIMALTRGWGEDEYPDESGTGR
jgi:AbrB family looped-hinge helix DNA binding protein